jgi:hypothetical protein
VPGLRANRRTTSENNMSLLSRAMAAALLTAGLAVAGVAAAESPTSGNDRPARTEDIAGSTIKRVILTQKAFERLAIETTPVREEPLLRWLMVESEVESASNAEPAVMTPDADADKTLEGGPLRLRVPVPDRSGQTVGRAILVLSLGATRLDAEDDKGEVDDEDDLKTDPKDGLSVDTGANKPVTVLILPIGGEHGLVRLRATPIEVGPGKDTEARYFAINDNDHGLQPGQHVFVRVTRADSGKLQKVIPYAAVIYDADGATWTYTNPEPLVFVRHAITVEYIEGDLAALKDGPDIGTAVVTVGAVELLGIEHNIGH